MSIRTLIGLFLVTDMIVVVILYQLSVMLALCFVTVQVLVQTASFTTTILLHRYLTHRGIIYLHPKIVQILKFVIWLFTGIDWREWGAVHLKHHAFTDKDGDPHSPHVQHRLYRWLPIPGWLYIQLLNIVEYVIEKRNPETIERYGSHIERYDGIWGYFPFSVSLMGPVTGLSALCMLLGTAWYFITPGAHSLTQTALAGLAWGIPTGLAHGFWYIFLSGSVNSLCHWFGYKNFDNTATNVDVVTMLTAGEGNHNNHHGYSRAAKFAATTDELDPAWIVIRWMVRRGWAQVFQSAIDAMETKAKEAKMQAQGA